jgi:hypothetical protein
VEATATEQLSSVEVGELPRQLVLKTTNPILLAYKYVHTEPPHRLALKVTRHSELEVLVATIEQAAYSTLFTRDGLAVTRAAFHVRNSRKQFLKVELPPDSRVWSVFVDGRPEKPALEEGPGGEGAGLRVLVKMINSTDGFPVEMVYATVVPRVASLGEISGELPRPDMVVTHSRWDLFLPEGPRYGLPESNMDLLLPGVDVARSGMEALLSRDGDEGRAAQSQQPLRIRVPTRGVHFAFEKLYANQGEEPTFVRVGYASAGGGRLAGLLSVLGALLLGVGAFALWGGLMRVGRPIALGAILAGAAALTAALGYLRADVMPPLWTTLAVVLAASAAHAARGWLRARRPDGRTGEEG